MKTLTEIVGQIARSGTDDVNVAFESGMPAMISLFTAATEVFPEMHD